MQPLKEPRPRTSTMIMVKDSAGRKFNRIEAYDREVNGKTIHVREHVRSNSRTCKGQK